MRAQREAGGRSKESKIEGKVVLGNSKTGHGDGSGAHLGKKNLR